MSPSLMSCSPGGGGGGGGTYPQFIILPSSSCVLPVELPRAAQLPRTVFMPPGACATPYCPAEFRVVVIILAVLLEDRGTL